MRSPIRNVLALCVVAAMLFNGCYRYSRIRGTELRLPTVERPQVVRVTLRDNTRVTFESPSLYDRGINGTVTECVGRSCDDVRGNRNVRFSSMSAIEARESRAGAVVEAVVLGLAGVTLVGGLIFLAALGSSGVWSGGGGSGRWGSGGRW